MTDAPGPSSTNGPRHARHRSTSGGNRTALVLGVVVAVLLAAGVVTWLVKSSSSTSTGTAATGGAPDSSTAGPASGDLSGTGSAGGTGAAQSGSGAQGASGTGCQGSGEPLRVAASPDIADDVAALASAVAAQCRVEVTPVASADVVANGSAGIDVWIPDSSMWLARAAEQGMAVPAAGVSVATSPVVFALAPAAAAGLSASGGIPDLRSILATRATANAIRVGLPDPAQSAAAVGAILAARAAVAGTTDARAALTWAVRSSPSGLPINSAALLDRLSADPGTAVPVSEESVISHNTGGSPAVAVYPGDAGVALDYPLVVLTDAPASVAAAEQLQQTLIGEQGRTALLDAGFRAPDGSPGPLMAASTGVNADVRVTAPLPSPAEVDDAIRQVQITNEPSRMLAVIDISGSMQAQVPGTGGASRMQLAKEAAARGLTLYPADSEIGLWEFSANLTPTTDYRQLIPVGTLGPDSQGGGTGAQRLAQALGAIQAIPDGGTGLYDTVLDAVRTMRNAWDPTKVNAVLLLTDGMNDDDNSISLQTLLSTLAAEQDPAKPVPVISIAFGPDSDVQSLGQISRATGGAAYVSLDPRQIGEIFLDAVGQRLCRPSC